MAPLALGLVVARILDGLGLAATIKWPNDLLVEGRKVAGILTETPGPWTFAGVGANLHDSPSEMILRLEGSLPATNLAAEGVWQDPLRFWLAILSERRRQPWIVPEDAEVCREEIEARLAWRGERILVRDPSQGPTAFEAVLLGLEADGSLRVRRGIRILVLRNASIGGIAPWWAQSAGSERRGDEAEDLR
jgi:BirA family biotin operon repressor/biotin-[acetyl-CoA-carboxylase] ligase